MRTRNNDGSSADRRAKLWISARWARDSRLFAPNGLGRAVIELIHRVKRRTGNPAYPAGSVVPTYRLARLGAVGGFSDLLGEDVCVTGVAGDFTDHAQVDEAQAYCADESVLGDVVEGVAGGDFI